MVEWMRFLLLLAACLGLAAVPDAQEDAPREAVPRTLKEEPLLRVLLAEAQRVRVDILAPVSLVVGERATTLEPGTLLLEVREDGWRIAGGTTLVRGPGRLVNGAEPALRVQALPRFGAPRDVLLQGDLTVRRIGDQVALIERVPMERYLASVVGAEMNPKWPAPALAAQAIVARSYAAARWMERGAEPWDVHWHFGVDMAYHGATPGDARVAAAIEPTRGQVLTYRGLPVLALFHASSGGRTEAFERVKPGVVAPDGKTPIAAAMPVVEDPAALPGADGLSLAATHGRWKADLPLPEITEALQAWSRAEEGRPPFGTVEGVSILERHADSGRVAKVSVRHVLDGERRFKTLDASVFRLAVSPVRIRSVWWDRCVIAAKAPGYLVLEGRGFGHGCGLSQVSAWYLARRGESATSIVARFYQGAKLERLY